MSKKILIVEDEEEIANMYKIKLELNGYKVSIASNGKIGLDIVSDVKPDLILLDLIMPEMDGIEFLKRLREMDDYKKTRVCILSNNQEIHSIEKVVDEGVCGYLLKSSQTPAQVAFYVDSLFKNNDEK